MRGVSCGTTGRFRLIAAILVDWKHERRLAPILSKIKLKVRAKRLRECFNDPQPGSRPDISG
jgi:hypothetical protein